MCSFPYVRDWLNEQPFRNEPNARLICNLHTGAPLKPKALWNMMKQLQKKVIRLSKNGEIEVVEEREKLEYLLNKEMESVDGLTTFNKYDFEKLVKGERDKLIFVTTDCELDNPIWYQVPAEDILVVRKENERRNVVNCSSPRLQI
jgi:hypothetical protein